MEARDSSETSFDVLVEVMHVDGEQNGGSGRPLCESSHYRQLLTFLSIDYHTYPPVRHEIEHPFHQAFVNSDLPHLPRQTVASDTRECGPHNFYMDTETVLI
ncbi:Protein of unknown function [Pyronema omphalodes CBS 100304]|uniref:Uncharacterized protein n=1 Tax=Pyronema omphalodes (strain CBS 100304) TaxID=1076935 RepID=U4KTS2_PYROM|nr:Protein of unknown function [Pyronema omphalodes CBS 100304]